MNAKTLAQVLLRIWGAVLIIWAVAGAGSLFLLFLPSANALLRANGAAAALREIVYFIAGILLFRRGDQIGEWLASDIEPRETPPASALEIEAIAFAILGVYLLVAGIRDIAGAVPAFFAIPGEITASAVVLGRPGQYAIPGLVNLVAGVILLFRRQDIAAALSRAWRRLRSRNDPE